jgi:phosphate transport system protein
MISQNYTDQGYAQELQEIRERLLLMSGRVERVIRDAIRSLVDRDVEHARATIQQDNAINLDEIEIDALCLTLLACRQPMASDLRFVIFTMKMVTDLERIADQAVNICERVIQLGSDGTLVPYSALEQMGTLVTGMVHDSIDAFVDQSGTLARDVIDRDDEVDELYHKTFRSLMSQMHQDSTMIPRCIHIQSIAKFLERMGDHSTNLAEQAIFMIKGKDIRHEGKL